MNDLVLKMIEQHQGGEVFFDNLDSNLKSQEFILYLWNKAVNKHKDFIPISSGKFGIYFSAFLREKGIDSIVVNGSLRSGEKIISLEPFSTKINNQKFIFFDDSFYLGRTRNAVKEEIEKWNGSILATYACYDGSKEKDDSVYSIYRYYK